MNLMLKKKFLILVFNQTGKFTLLLIYKIFKKIIVKVLFHFFSKKHRDVIQSALDKLNCDLKDRQEQVILKGKHLHGKRFEQVFQTDLSWGSLFFLLISQSL